MTEEEKSPGESKTLIDEDCYFDGPLMVFTAAYHLKRGYCCENGCRHCPYGKAGNDGSAMDDGSGK